MTKVLGDPDHLISRGYICEKASHALHYQNTPRITSPLKKMPDGSFSEVSWDQATKEIAEKLKSTLSRYGKDSLLMYFGNDSSGPADSDFYYNGIGGKLITHTIAQEKFGSTPVQISMYGKVTFEDFDNSQVLMIVGKNIYQSHGRHGERVFLNSLKKSDRTLIVVDPCLTPTAKKAHIHLQLKPGTDSWLLGAIAAVLVQQNLIDEEWVRSHCNGFEEVKAALTTVNVQQYSDVCGVSVEQIENTARVIASANTFSVYEDLGSQHTWNPALNSYLGQVISVLTKNFAKLGAAVPLTMFTWADKLINKDQTGDSVFDVISHYGTVPPVLIPDMILNPQSEDKKLRSMILTAVNPVISMSDSNLWEKALTELDMLVVFDITMSETAKYAHYILPTAAHYEKTSVSDRSGFYFPDYYVALHRPVLAPPNGVLSEVEIYYKILSHFVDWPPESVVTQLRKSYVKDAKLFKLHLAQVDKKYPVKRLFRIFAHKVLEGVVPPGYQLATPLLQTIEAFIHRAPSFVPLKYRSDDIFVSAVRMFTDLINDEQGICISNMDVEAFFKLGKKVHLAITDLIPQINNIPTGPTTSDEFPFIAMVGNRTTHDSFPYTNVLSDPYVCINPEDMNSIGVADGDIVLLKSIAGEITAAARAFTENPAGIVIVPNFMKKYGANRLTSINHNDPLTKMPMHRYVPVSVTKANK